jgi:hypothetical protein
MSLREVSFATALSDLLRKSETLKRAEESGETGGDQVRLLLADVIRSAKKMTEEYEKYSASRLQLSFGDRQSDQSNDPYSGLAALVRAKSNPRPMGESEFADWAKLNGWRTEKRGWPTYLCTKDSGEVLAVNVSPLLRDGTTKRLNRARSEVMTCFQESNLRSFVFNGTELIDFDSVTHSPARDAHGKLSQSPSVSLPTARSRFRQRAVARGWAVFGTGWPDFACFSPQSEMIAVEVKRRFANGAYEQLQPHQAQVMMALSQSGVKCYLSNGAHLEPFNAEKHGWRMLEDRP